MHFGDTMLPGKGRCFGPVSGGYRVYLRFRMRDGGAYQGGRRNVGRPEDAKSNGTRGARPVNRGRGLRRIESLQQR